MTVTFRDVIMSNSKAICKCLIKKNMNLEEAMAILCKVIEQVENGVDLDKVKLKELGLTDLTKLKTNVLTAIINALIAKDNSLALSINGFQQSVSNINGSLNNLKDEKVKTGSTNGETAGYLSDKIATNQPGSISVTTDFKVLITGFVPVGAVFYINKSRLVDFEVNGKGKANTDVYGYAISNGANGTTNRLGKFPRYAADITKGGDQGGSNSLVLTANHIPSLELPIQATVGTGLGPKVFDIKVNTNRLTDGSGGGTTLVRYTAEGDGNSPMKINMDLSHSHSISGKATRDNATPTQISLVPEHILEIPIERITV
jgi:hypothetical protein